MFCHWHPHDDISGFGVGLRSKFGGGRQLWLSHRELSVVVRALLCNEGVLQLDPMLLFRQCSESVLDIGDASPTVALWTDFANTLGMSDPWANVRALLNIEFARSSPLVARRIIDTNLAVLRIGITNSFAYHLDDAVRTTDPVHAADMIAPAFASAVVLAADKGERLGNTPLSCLAGAAARVRAAGITDTVACVVEDTLVEFTVWSRADGRRLLPQQGAFSRRVAASLPAMEQQQGECFICAEAIASLLKCPHCRFDACERCVLRNYRDLGAEVEECERAGIQHDSRAICARCPACRRPVSDHDGIVWRPGCARTIQIFEETIAE